MLVIKDKVETKIEYPIPKLGNPDKILYFDIETTGFSRKYCMIYLIGCMYFVGGQPYYTQWFAENANEEANILMAFSKFLEGFDTIIHFNGNSFDMPFIKERGEKYRLDFDFTKFRNIDIYKATYRFSHLLKLENNKQKSYETLLGIKRTDPFSGGDLIEVYKEFLRTRDEMLILPLLLHNKEDVWYMGNLTNLLALHDFFEGDFIINSYEIKSYSDINGDTKKELFIVINLNQTISFPVSYKFDYGYLKMEYDTTYISISIYSYLLKYFFSDYREYYYLPDEDRAIHKSVASFVDKNHRIQATAATCYTKVNGEFLPVFSNKSDCFNQILFENYNDKSGYIELKTIKESSIELYVNCLLNFIKKKPEK